MLHAGYVGRSARFAGVHLGNLHHPDDPVAGPIELAPRRVIAAPVGTLRSRLPGRDVASWPFDAPRDLLSNIRRSSLR